PIAKRKLKTIYLLVIICTLVAASAAYSQEASNPTFRVKEKSKTKAKPKLTAEEKAKAERAERKLHEPFLKRLDAAFLEQLRTPAYPPLDPSTPNSRRIPPPPFDSPPFPSGDWQINGTPIIGDPGELAPYSLMQAIYEGPSGDAWKKSKV